MRTDGASSPLAAWCPTGAHFAPFPFWSSLGDAQRKQAAREPHSRSSRKGERRRWSRNGEAGKGRAIEAACPGADSLIAKAAKWIRAGDRDRVPARPAGAKRVTRGQIAIETKTSVSIESSYFWEDRECRGRTEVVTRIEMITAIWEAAGARGDARGVLVGAAGQPGVTVPDPAEVAGSAADNEVGITRLWGVAPGPPEPTCVCLKGADRWRRPNFSKPRYAQR